MCTRISLIQERGSTKLKNLQKFYFNSRNSLNHSSHWFKIRIKITWAAMKLELVDLVKKYLKLKFYSTSYFYSALLLSVDLSVESVYFTAVNLKHLNRFRESLNLLESNKSMVKNDVCCLGLLIELYNILNNFKLSIHYNKLLLSLLERSSGSDRTLDDLSGASNTPLNPVYVHLNLANNFKFNNQLNQARHHYELSLKFDSNLWESFDNLCLMGLNPSNGLIDITGVSHISSNIDNLSSSARTKPLPIIQTPLNGNNDTFNDDSFSLPPSVLPKRPKINNSQQNLKFTPDSINYNKRNNNKLSLFTSKVSKRKKLSPKQSKLSRFNQISTPINNIQSQEIHKDTNNIDINETTNISLNSLVKTLAEAKSALGSFSNQHCITLLNNLLGTELGQGANGSNVGNSIGRTPSVLCWLGRAYFESADYLNAEKSFAACRAISPNRCKDMDIYSTVLWHLNKPTSLAFLAHDLIKIDKHCHESWIALGNALSLSNQNSDALVAFTKASIVNPYQAYSSVLAGHECIYNENWDMAINFFQTAIKIDRRCYNAWYGLGNVYLNQGNIQMSEEHYKRACEINSTNIVLLCSYANSIEKSDRPFGIKLQLSLGIYNKAVQLNTNSPLARFKRSNILFQMNRFDEALQDLIYLKDAAPDEVNVHLLLGKLYRKLSNSAGAAKHFAIAQDIEPKCATLIGEIIENNYK